MLKYVIPQMSLANVPPTIGAALIGAIIAGAYGILHDQVTYTIAPEYFTRLKFRQFHYADLGLGNREFVATIGFLATWWVGFISAWFLARRLIPGQPRDQAYRQIRAGLGCIIACGFLFGLIGYAYGLWRGPNADYSSWDLTFSALDITDHWAFVRVAYIHNAGYLGGLVGLIIALVAIRPTHTRHNTSSDVNVGT
jgi:hypothetical protein